jgi:hypothetical protein
MYRFPWQQCGDRGGGGGEGSGRRGDGAHVRVPVEEDEEVVVAATHKGRRESAHGMHAPRRHNTTRQACLTTGQEAQRETSAKGHSRFCDLSAATPALKNQGHAGNHSLPDESSSGDVSGESRGRGTRSPAGGREGDGDCVANDAAGGDQGDGKCARTRLEGSRAEEGREGSSLPPVEEPGRGRGGRWRRWRGRRWREIGGREAGEGGGGGSRAG